MPTDRLTARGSGVTRQRSAAFVTVEEISRPDLSPPLAGYIRKLVGFPQPRVCAVSDQYCGRLSAAAGQRVLAGRRRQPLRATDGGRRRWQLRLGVASR